MYKYNNVECINYIPAINNNVEQVINDSDINDNDNDNDNKGYNKNDVKKCSYNKSTGNKDNVEILIKNLKKQIIKIETLSKNSRDKRDIEGAVGAVGGGGVGGGGVGGGVGGVGGVGGSHGINIFKISNPLINNIKTNKKYIGLIFISDTFIKSSFITLSKNVYIINYYITLKIDDRNIFNNNYFFSLGIKNNDLNKVSIIKGSKQHINIKNNINDNQIIIKDMLLYEAYDNQELCLIAEFNKRSKIIEDKSMIKIAKLYPYPNPNPNPTPTKGDKVHII